MTEKTLEIKFKVKNGRDKLIISPNSNLDCGLTVGICNC